MRNYLFLLLIFICLGNLRISAQVTGSFVVNGDIDKYYPVTFNDGAWLQNSATELEIGRSKIHTDGTSRGSLISKFRYHVRNWGNEAHFIDADIRTGIHGSFVVTNFIGGWVDVTSANSDANIVIWLRGGSTTYYYKANVSVGPGVYDGVTRSLPYRTTNGVSYNYKTAPDSYVINSGVSLSNSLSVNGNVGIGTTSSQEKLAVNGAMTLLESYYKISSSTGLSWANTNLIGHGWHANQDFTSIQVPGNAANTGELKLFSDGNVAIGSKDNYGYKLSVNGTALFTKAVVKNFNNWPDYVFDSSYQLPSLDSVAQFIQENKHLPEIPSASVVEKDGHDLGEVQKLLLKKVEELTLYVIEQDKRIKELKTENESIQLQNQTIKQELKKIQESQRQ